MKSGQGGGAKVQISVMTCYVIEPLMVSRTRAPLTTNMPQQAHHMVVPFLWKKELGFGE